MALYFCAVSSILNFYVEVYVYFEFKPTNNYDIKYN